MDPFTIYRLAKYQHAEIEAEFERYHRYRLDYPLAAAGAPRYRRFVGWGSLILGALVLVQQIIG
ncbi:MAG: hypothetical protein Fur0044_41980 [Anaerolineae bacterium]|nr:hypothetical protein [Anaerolineales bacterium]MCQ3977512.1 hypothetical protein [Anaerolineae bacterium]